MLISVLVLVAARAAAEDPVLVPGGPASYRRLLGLDPQRPDSAFFVDLHEVLLFESREDASWSKVETRRRAADFILDLTDWRERFGNPARFAVAPGDQWIRCARALDWLGFTVAGAGAAFTLQRRPDATSARRQSFLDVLGIPTATFFARLHDGETVTVDVADGTVPLPFGLKAWRETVSAPGLSAEDAFLYFLKNVRASRMLVALHDLDPETREELRVLLEDPKGRPIAWKVLYEEALDSFSRYPEALVLRGGRFVLPGGPAADPIWAETFGVPPSQPRAFLEALYRKDDGKGAYVVDVLQHLPDEKARELLLGLGPGGFRRMYASIDSAENHERTHRDPYDFAHLAPFVSLSQGPAPAIAVSGRAEFPRNEAELARVVAEERDGAGTREDSLRRLFGHDVTTSAGGFPAQRRFLFLSRLLADNPNLADPGLIVLLDRGLDRFLPAYALLEDIPFSRPELVRRYVFTLDRLERRGTSRQGEVAAGLFQADAVLLALLTRAGSLDPAQAESLFAALLDVPLFAGEDSSPARDEARLFHWLSGRLLPVLRENARQAERSGSEEGRDPDALIESALVGAAHPSWMTWRGGRYRVDPAAEEVSRRRAFRETQRLAWVADLETWHDLREKVLAAAEGRELDGAKAAAAELSEGLGVGPDAEGLRGGAGDERIDKTEKRASEAAAAIAATRDAAGLSAVPGHLEALDALLAERHLEAMLGHVYAASAGNPDNLYYQDPSFVKRHSFRSVESGGVPVRTAFTATELVEQQDGGGSRVSGSLFGLADVLGLLHADQLAYRGGARIPSETIRSGLVAPIWRMSVSRLDDDGLEVVAASCRATVEFAQELAGSPPRERFLAWDALARDLVPRSRLAELAALDTAPSEKSLAPYLSPSDLYRIGRRLLSKPPSPDTAALPAVSRGREAMARLEKKYGPAGSRERLAEFGPRATAYAGCTRLADMEMPPYERLAAYRRPEMLSERLYDLKIAVACRVAEAQLPAAVLPVVLPAALDAMLVELTMAYPYDWSATTRAAFAFSLGDLDRILDGAVQAGILVRDDDAAPAAGTGS